jgi:hypothetical protein
MLERKRGLPLVVIHMIVTRSLVLLDFLVQPPAYLQASICRDMEAANGKPTKVSMYFRTVSHDLRVARHGGLTSPGMSSILRGERSRAPPTSCLQLRGARLCAVQPDSRPSEAVDQNTLLTISAASRTR